MNFDFIPYKLNADISHFKDNIQYISSDNGVDLYKTKGALNAPIFDILISDVNLYFLDRSLITVYVHLTENPENFEQVIKIIESAIKEKPKRTITGSQMIHAWFNEDEFLGVIRSNELYLYHSLKQYNIFQTCYQ